MTAHNYLYLTAMVFALMGWQSAVYGENDVTVISTTTATPPPKQKADTSDGTPVVHKSLHKKKHAVTETASANPTPAPTTPAASASSVTVVNKPVKDPAPTVVTTTHPQPTVTPMPAHPPAVVATTTPPQSIPPTNTTVAKNPPAPNTVVLVPASPVPNTAASGPTVETGLPVARYPGMGSPIRGVSTYVPMPAMITPAKPITGTPTHQTYIASALPSSVAPLTSASTSTYSSPSRPTSPSSNFVFTNFSKKTKVAYPWRTGIITTMFWIGEGDTPISRTTNEASSWDEDWRANNHGADSPNNRNGYAAGGHASTLNPFYVALPFNDLALPDKARRWLPPGWYRRPQDGKQVSACKDRWVEIKNQRGDYCYAQWEDVGPLNYSDAEYVFGNGRPNGLGDNHAGLDVSPAVAQYLGIDGKNRITSWRFVDDEDVRPGAWLKLDEQAVLYTALHQLKNAKSSSALPIQKASEPAEDVSNTDSNKKKVDASKG